MATVKLSMSIKQRGASFMDNEATYHNVGTDGLEYFVKKGESDIAKKLASYAVQGGEYELSLWAQVDGVSAGPALVVTVDRDGLHSFERKFARLVMDLVDDSEDFHREIKRGKSRGQIWAAQKKRHGW